MLGQFVPGPLKPLATRLKRSLSPATTDAPLAPEACRGELRAKAYSVRVEAGKELACPTRVTNLGPAVWSPRGAHPVALQFTWTTSRKVPIDGPPVTVELPAAIYPGESAEVPATLIAPGRVGRFLVGVSIRQPGGPDFPGVRPLLLDADVTGPAVEDIDYHSAFATADLALDYWTVVGPSTQAEYHRLADEKMVLLKAAGLTPDSRVLDVGCGTGQLAFPLEAYLTDKGGYTGTDIGVEAIPFCRGRFKRPNFRFEPSEMTRLPLADERFDLATFFSVFTHTYPDETALLLAEAARLLAPGGAVVGDFFVSAATERCAGNRGKMEVNAEHLHRLVALAGLTPEVLHDWPQSPHLSRRLYRFTRAA